MILTQEQFANVLQSNLNHKVNILVEVDMNLLPGRIIFHIQFKKDPIEVVLPVNPEEEIEYIKVSIASDCLTEAVAIEESQKLNNWFDKITNKNTQ